MTQQNTIGMNAIRYRRDLWKALPYSGPTAEIGVAEGNFSEEILNWVNNTDQEPISTHHYLVDRWASVPSQYGDAAMSQNWHDENLARVRERMAKFSIRADILRGNSDEMAKFVLDGSLVLLYIDGDHSYEGVTKDITAWASKVARGGIIAFHDYENPNYGVKEAVRDFCKDHTTIYLIPEDKPEDAGAYFYVNSF